ncbi:MAG: SCO family protein [Anaerolineae bacterium]
MRRLALIVFGLAIGLAVGYGAIQVVQRTRPLELHGTTLNPPIPAPDVTLTAVSGDAHLSDFQGEIMLIYFGYTYCPDICPATLSDLAKVQRAADDDGGDLQVVMITIDPERDTPAALADYVAHFHPSFVGLSGTQEQIAAAAAAYGIYYAKQSASSEVSYLMDHTSSVLLVDGQGQTRAIYSFGTSPQEILADVQALLKQR